MSYGKTLAGVALLGLTLVSPARAALDRPLAVDFGMGIPQLLAVGAQVQVSPSWQLGATYGLVPGLTSLGQASSLGSQPITLANGQPYTVRPAVSTKLATVTPFVRWFPTERNAYLQLSYAMLRVNATVRGDLYDGETQAAPNVIAGEVTVTQTLPTISMGHLFAGKLFFFNLNLGFTFISTTLSNLAITGAIPDAFGGAAANQVAVDQANAAIGQAVQSAATVYKSRFSILPSITLAFGLIL